MRLTLVRGLLHGCTLTEQCSFLFRLREENGREQGKMCYLPAGSAMLLLCIVVLLSPLSGGTWAVYNNLYPSILYYIDNKAEG